MADAANQDLARALEPMAQRLDHALARAATLTPEQRSQVLRRAGVKKKKAGSKAPAARGAKR